MKTTELGTDISGTKETALRNVAKLSNVLAKQLTGDLRDLAYRIKAQACSSLIVEGQASVNGIWPGGIIALSIREKPSGIDRIHIRRSHLSSAAKQIVDRQSQYVPTVTRLGDHVQIRKEK